MGLMSDIKNPNKMVTSIIMLIIGVTILAAMLPSVVTSIVNLSTSGIGFASFFQANGIVLLGLGAAILMGIIGIFGLGSSKR